MTISPYITATIVIQLLGMIIPALEKVIKEGVEEGKAKVNRYTKILTFALALIEAIGIYISYQSSGIFVNPGLATGALVVLALVTGTAILMWLGAVSYTHLVEEFIKPIFLPKFIVDTYACIQKRGLHAAIEKLRDYMKKKYKENEAFYILKCDISKFFYSIQKDILINIISRYVKDADFLELTKKIIYDGTGKVGIPIGNYTCLLYTSQEEWPI